jgi:hypothetical protein
MNENTAILKAEDDLLVDLTFHDLPATLLTEFTIKVVRPYYKGNLNQAIHDLMQKALRDQDFVLSHISHVRNYAEP